MESDKDSDQDSDVDQDQDSKDWTTESMNKLIHQVMAQTSPGEAIPYHLREIDWDKVKWGSHTVKNCEQKWDELLTKVRHYRTVFEVATDMIGFLDRKSANSKVLHWNNTLKKGHGQSKSTRSKKKKEDPDNQYPQKPRSSAYAIFSVEKLNQLKSENLKGKEVMVRVGNVWSNMAPEKKQQYQVLWEKEKKSYLSQLEEFGRKHPEDDKIKEMIQDAMKKVNHPSKKIKNYSSATSVDQKSSGKKSLKKSKSAHHLDQSGVTDGSVDSDLEAEIRASKSSPLKSPTKKKGSASSATVTSPGSPTKLSPKKLKKEPGLDHSQLTDVTLDSGMETTTTGPDSPIKSPKKRSHKGTDATSNEEPPRKKKHKQRRVTGELLYIEQKREGYRLEHPDIDSDDLEEKLKKKYSKFSEKKSAKYDQLAAELSTNS